MLNLPDTITELPGPFAIGVIDALKDLAIKSLDSISGDEAQRIIDRINAMGNSFSEKTKVYKGISELDNELNYLLIDYTTQSIYLITARQLE